MMILPTVFSASYKANNVAGRYCSIAGSDDDLTYDLLLMIWQVMWQAVTNVCLVGWQAAMYYEDQYHYVLVWKSRTKVRLG